MKLKLLFVVIVIFAMAAFGQKMKVESGNFSFLNGQSELKVEFNFDKATFYNEKMSEEEYIDKRIQDITADKSKAEADKWSNDWNYSKENTFIDKFISSFNKNIDIKASKEADSKYTLIVETTWIYPGWFVGVMKQPAKVSTSLRFVETANPGNVLLVIGSQSAPGDGNLVGVANNNDRIAEGYAKTAKTLAKLISKKVK